MEDNPLEKFDPNNLIPAIDGEIEKKGEIFTTQSNIEAPTPGVPIEVELTDKNKQKDLLKYVDDCNQLQGYYVEKHEELKMVFALLLNLFQIYKYSVSLLGNMKTAVTAAATEGGICSFPERTLIINELTKGSGTEKKEEIELFKSLSNKGEYDLEISIKFNPQEFYISSTNDPLSNADKPLLEAMNISTSVGNDNIESQTGAAKLGNDEISLDKFKVNKNIYTVRNLKNLQFHITKIMGSDGKVYNQNDKTGPSTGSFGIDGFGLCVILEFTLTPKDTPTSSTSSLVQLFIYHVPKGDSPVIALGAPSTAVPMAFTGSIKRKVEEKWVLNKKDKTAENQFTPGYVTVDNSVQYLLRNIDLDGDYFFTLNDTNNYIPEGFRQGPKIPLKKLVTDFNTEINLNSETDNLVYFTLVQSNYNIDIIKNADGINYTVIFYKLAAPDAGTAVKLVFNEYNDKIQKLREHQKALMGKIEEIAPIITSPEFKESYDVDAPTKTSENFVETNKKKLEELNKLKGGSINPKQLAKLSNNTLSKTQQKMNINTMINNLIGGFSFYNPTTFKRKDGTNYKYYIIYIVEEDTKSKDSIDFQNLKARIKGNEKGIKEQSFLHLKENKKYLAFAFESVIDDGANLDQNLILQGIDKFMDPNGNRNVKSSKIMNGGEMKTFLSELGIPYTAPGTNVNNVNNETNNIAFIDNYIKKIENYRIAETTSKTESEKIAETKNMMGILKSTFFQPWEKISKILREAKFQLVSV